MQPKTAEEIGPKPLDRSVVRRAKAAEKLEAQGKKLDHQQKRDLRRYRDHQEQIDQVEFLLNLPKGLYAKLSGRQHKILNEQAERHGLPISGPTINLAHVLTEFHNQIARSEPPRGGDDPADGDDLLDGEPSDGLERYRMARAKEAEVKLAVLTGGLVDIAEVRSSFESAASHLADARTELARMFGESAASILDLALERADQELKDALG